jgi:beta-glucosidase
MQAKAVELAQKADVVLLYLGLDEISESEGLDRASMKLPQSQVDLLGAVSAVNPNVVIVMSAGSAVEMPWLGQCKALIHGYLCGQAGAGAMLRAILGEVNPSGKLAESYPLRYEDNSSAPYFPAKQRTAEYREGLYVGYRAYDSANIPVLFPFGYGLSYTSFAYSDLNVSEKEVSFTLTNTGAVDGAEVAQLYVSKTDGQVFRPRKELKGFAKVFLKAGESRKVTIPLDDKAFRYFNVKTDRFEVEGGGYQILIGASSADVKLTGTVNVKGTDAPLPYDPAKLPSYYAGTISAVPDTEFETLLGRPIPDGSWSGTLDMNDAICQMYYAKSGVARFAWKKLTNMLNKSIEKGEPDLNITFIYNMPFRGIAKMAGGMCTMEMAEGILTIVNGHFFKGLGRVIGGFARSGKKRKAAESIK